MSAPSASTAHDALSYEWLLHPLAPDRFARDSFERTHCLIRRDDPAYYARLLSWADLDQVLGAHAARFPDIKLVQKGHTIDREEFCDDGVIDARRVVALYHKGATIIFGQLQAHLPALAQMCANLTRVFPGRVQTNIYVTPPDAQGFECHWDTHDVFVLQVSGSKTWRLYDTPIALPLRGQTFDPKEHAAGAVTAEFELAAGDLLYIPRGLVHSAHATVDHSLHITTGIIAATWTDLFVDAVCAAGVRDVSLRESLPLGFAHMPAAERDALLRRKIEALLPSLEAPDLFPAAADDLRAHHRPLFTNLLEQSVRAVDLGARSRLRARRDALWDLVSGDAGAAVLFAGTEIAFPPASVPVLEHIRRHEEFTVAELPDAVDLDSRLTIVRRLVREGVLERAG